jgi:hypothetical protein
MFNDKTWALAVGIDEYDFDPPVPGAVNAAVEFAALLCGRGVKPEQVYLCLGPDPAGGLPGVLKEAKRWPPTYAGMRILLERELPKSAGALLCVFWAGHGAVDGRARRLYLADSEMHGTFDVDGLVWLLGDNTRYKVAKQLIFLDACANDPGRFGMHKRYFDFGMDAARAPSEGQFIFFSASLGLPAYFANGTGAFSAELVRLLKAEAPPLSPEDLRDRLREHFDRAGGVQRPSYHFRYEDAGGVVTWGGPTGAPVQGTGPMVRPDVPPSLPVGYIDRAAELAALRALLLRDPGKGMAITAVRGMPGAGKTVLVTALLRDPAVARAYPDGILWVKVGRDANPSLMMHKVAVALREPWGDHDGSDQVRQLLCRRKALIVLDDVWDAKHVLNFREDRAAGSALLVTTRRADVVAQTGAVERRLGTLTGAEALCLLASRCGQAEATLPAEASPILEECGRLALAVAIAGARLRGQPPAVWGLVLEQLRSADQDGVGSLEEYEHKGVFRAIHVSVRDLPETARGRYFDIGVFPEGAGVPTAALETLWNVGSKDALSTVVAWVDRALAEFDAAGRVTFHDLHLDYARAYRDPAPIHGRLLDSYVRRSGGDIETPVWSAVPDDGYFRRYLTHHLEAAARPEDVHALLAEETPSGEKNAWYEAKVAVGDVPGYLADVRRAWRLAGRCDRGDPEAVAAGLALQVRYLLVTSSVRSIFSRVSAGLWADVLAEGVLPTEVTLALIGEVPEAPGQAEVLLGVMDRLDEANRREAAHRVLALAERMEPPEAAAILTRLTPHLPPAARQKALDLAASAAGATTSSCVRVDTLCVQAALAIDATERRERLDEALVVAKQLPHGAAAWGRLVRLALLLPDKVAEIVEVFLARKADEGGLREEYFGHVATLLPLVGDGERHKVVQEALAAANSERDAFQWARLLRPLASYLPEGAVLGRWETVRGRLARHAGAPSLNFIAPAGVEIAGLLQADARALVTGEVVAAVRAMTFPQGVFGVYGKAEAIVRLIPLVAGEMRASLQGEALQAAAQIDEPQARARVLHLLAGEVEKAARGAIVREAWDAARRLDDAANVVGAIGEFAPWLDGEWVKRALEMVKWHLARAQDSGKRDFSLQRSLQSSLQRLAAQLARLRDTGGALSVLAGIEDEDGKIRAHGLLGMVDSLAEDDLDNALAVVRDMPPGRYRALARWALASRFPEMRDELFAEAFREPFGIRYPEQLARMTADLVRLGHLREPVRVVRETVEDYDVQTAGLQSIAGSLPRSTNPADVQWLLGEVNALLGPDGDLGVAWALAPGLCDGQVVRRALEGIVAERHPVVKLKELGRWLPHLSEGDRADGVRHILSAVRASTDDVEKGKLLDRAAPYLPKQLIGEASRLAATIDHKYIRWLLLLPARFAELRCFDEARRFVDSIGDAVVRARALAGMLPHVPEGQRMPILKESFAFLSESDDEFERRKAWRELEPALTTVPVTDLELVWRDTLLRIAGKRRAALYMDVAGMLPLINILGGMHAVRLAFEALCDTSRWWN